MGSIGNAEYSAVEKAAAESRQIKEKAGCLWGLERQEPVMPTDEVLAGISAMGNCCFSCAG